jgi:hypothetical protein
MAQSSLVKRLRIKPRQRLLVLNSPQGYVQSLTDLPEGVVVSESPGGKYDLVHLFVKNRAEFARLGDIAMDAVEYDGLLWISYPKGSSKVETDLARGAMWDLTADRGLRPVAQVSIDEVWSAVRFRPAELVAKTKSSR